jgi:hypothetical protein
MQTNAAQVTVEWSKGVIQFSELDGDYRSLDDNGFYAILGGSWDESSNKWTGIRLLYIGQAYAQTIRERVKQPHDSYSCIQAYLREHARHEALLRTGIIAKCSQERITQELVDDIEACLIRSNRPRCNVQSKYSYGGRTIAITNTGGYYPLLQTCSCAD